MNSKLKKAVYRKQMLHNNYKKYRDTKSWELYRQQRNLVTKIKRESVKNYFIQRCVGGPKSKDFWPTIKSFLTNKGCNFQSDIILNENDNLLTSQSDICDVFNNFFTNVAKDIGKDSVSVDVNHPSILEINKIRTGNEKDDFVFKHINEVFVDKQICKLSVKKATGDDEISPKILKLAKPAVVKPIA